MIPGFPIPVSFRKTAVRVLLSTAFLICLDGPIETVQAQGTPSAASQPAGSSSLQDWQQRRMALFQALNGKDQQKATAALDASLTAFEKDPVGLTPMEAMDLYGVFYVPREGASNMHNLLKAIAMQATLGWYDALRFTDETGRAEISDKDGFFKRAFLMGGGAGMQQLMTMLAQHPDDAAKAVADGIALAAQYRDHVNYDEHWPSAYGQASARCAAGQNAACLPPPALPPSQWDAAFTQASAVVTQYYRKSN